jgi:hypothetical protein
MSANTLPVAPKGTNTLLRLARSTILLCTISLGACAGLPSPNVAPEFKPVSQVSSHHSFAAPTDQWSGKVWWRLHAW